MNYKTIKFHTTTLYKLKNDEFRYFIQRVFNLLSEAEIEDTYIIDTMDNARKHLEVMNEYNDKPIAHDNTQVVKDMFIECRDHLISLKMFIEGFKRAVPEGKQAQVKALYLWIRTERKNLATKNRGDQAAVVARLTERVYSNAEIAEALESLSLDKHFQTIVNLSNDIIKLLQDRESDKTSESMKRETKNVLGVKDIHTMLMAVAGRANIDGPNRSYFYNLCMEMQKYLTAAGSLMKSRETRAENEKNASEGETNVDSSGESESGDINVPEADHNDHTPEPDPTGDDEA